MRRALSVLACWVGVFVSARVDVDVFVSFGKNEIAAPAEMVNFVVAFWKKRRKKGNSRVLLSGSPALSLKKKRRTPEVGQRSFRQHNERWLR